MVPVCYAVIVRAVAGEDEALYEVARHYNRYIRWCVRIRIMEPQGEYRYWSDEEIIGEIENLLILFVLKFEFR